ncbi:5'/3'-nucleotidase SurE [Kribbella qitaiheensis]|uniref:5'/3'-nucleotidase SurE n=1 Tax=Kribbella qitaiheensis TaxID=1544730 RepID=UPI0024836920|nr:5'/3'-nucleotidase SurE [Kribbella qitaiheensis]
MNRPIATATEDADGVTYIGVDGTPALAVTMARLGAFGKSPEVVVSGINHGYNFGPILHSGTVGAALTGATQGMSGLAVSIGSEDPQYLEVAAEVAVELLAWLRGQPTGTVLNLNVPDVPKAELRGVRSATLAAVNPSRLKAGVAPTGEPIMILRDPDPAQDPDSDEALLAEGYITVTSITGVQALPDTAAADHLARRLP